MSITIRQAWDDGIPPNTVVRWDNGWTECREHVAGWHNFNLADMADRETDTGEIIWTGHPESLCDDCADWRLETRYE